MNLCSVMGKGSDLFAMETADGLIVSVSHTHDMEALDLCSMCL